MSNNLGENLLRYTYKTKSFNTFDCETESLNLRYSRPWSVSWILSKGDNVIDVQDRYLWWEDLNISTGARILTKFDYSEYKRRAEDPKKVYEEFAPILYNNQVINIAHNSIGLDYSQVDSWRRAIGIVEEDYSFQDHYVDTNCLEKAIRLSLKPQYPLLEWLFKLDSIIQKGLKTNLPLLSKEYELEADENKFHGALYDSEKTRQLFLKQIFKIELEDKFV